METLSVSFDRYGRKRRMSLFLEMSPRRKKWSISMICGPRKRRRPPPRTKLQITSRRRSKMRRQMQILLAQMMRRALGKLVLDRRWRTRKNRSYEVKRINKWNSEKSLWSWGSLVVPRVAPRVAPRVPSMVPVVPLTRKTQRRVEKVLVSRLRRRKGTIGARKGKPIASTRQKRKNRATLKSSRRLRKPKRTITLLEEETMAAAAEEAVEEVVEEVVAATLVDNPMAVVVAAVGVSSSSEMVRHRAISAEGRRLLTVVVEEVLKMAAETGTVVEDLTGLRVVVTGNEVPEEPPPEETAPDGPRVAEEEVEGNIWICSGNCGIVLLRSIIYLQ
mmetsp:Transcript_28580/g.82734  ORF Transcript_28580/g.82734 Transcript_28580/m.82734 type:complete len:332 (-) Transcript_28580:74-1069(-)